MEYMIELTTLIVNTPLYLGMLIYALCALVQLLISSHFIRKRNDILREEYNFTGNRFTFLWFISAVLFPVSWYYGIKAAWEKFREWRMSMPIERAEVQQPESD